MAAERRHRRITGRRRRRRAAGRLDNGGEAIVLVYGTNLIIQEFAFDDAWHPATDGDGYSLVIVDPRGKVTAAPEWVSPTPAKAAPAGQTGK